MSNLLLKSLFVLLVCAIPIIWPQPIPLTQNLPLAFFMPLLVGLLVMIPRIYARTRTFGQSLEPPKWGDAIFDWKNPLQLFRFLPFFQFVAIALAASGGGLLVGTYLAYGQIQAFGIGCIGMGIGIIAGIEIGLRLTKQ